MSNDLLLPIVIAIVAGFFLYKNVNIQVYKAHIEDTDEFELFKRYATIIEVSVEEILYDIESPNPRKWVLIENSDFKNMQELLKDHKRILNFYQTELARSKSKDEIQNAFFEILSSLDTQIIAKFQNGEKLADDLRQNLQQSYQQLTQR